jgi:hypothetical protein
MEFKKLVEKKNADIANSARFAKGRKMYRISHIVENGQILQKVLMISALGDQNGLIISNFSKKRFCKF